MVQLDPGTNEKEIGGILMPKMKSNRALMKRIKVTANGKIKRKHAYMGHLAPRKTRKQKKHLAKATYMNPVDMPRIRAMINFKVK